MEYVVCAMGILMALGTQYVLNALGKGKVMLLMFCTMPAQAREVMLPQAGHPSPMWTGQQHVHMHFLQDVRSLFPLFNT